MGNSPCNSSPETVDGFFSLARNASIIPDITLDRTLAGYLSLGSGALLSRQYTDIRRSLSPEQLSAFDRDLRSTFGDEGRVAFGGIGVVALALALLLEALANHTRGQDAGAEDPIRRVFGADHSSEVGALTSGYLKQVPKAVGDPQKMQRLTERYDRELTRELIYLHEVISVDRRVSSAAVKQWLNGAALHLHMRVHLVRAGGVHKGSATSLSVCYRTAFPGLLASYKDYLQRHVKETPPASGPGLLTVDPSRNVTHHILHAPCESQAIGNGIVAKILEAQDIQRSVDFFQKTEEHMDSLVDQKGDFSLLTKV